MERKYIFGLHEFDLSNDEEETIACTLESDNDSYHRFYLDHGFFFTKPGDEIHTKIINHLKMMQVYDEILTEKYPYVLVSISW